MRPLEVCELPPDLSMLQAALASSLALVVVIARIRATQTARSKPVSLPVVRTRSPISAVVHQVPLLIIERCFVTESGGKNRRRACEVSAAMPTSPINLQLCV